MIQQALRCSARLFRRSANSERGQAQSTIYYQTITPKALPKPAAIPRLRATSALADSSLRQSHSTIARASASITMDQITYMCECNFF